MGSVFVLILLGLPDTSVWLISMAVLFLFAASRTADAVYVLSEEGIQQELTPIIGKKNIRKKFFSWKQIKWYTDGTELSRSGKEYQYLKIGFLNSKAVWTLSTLHGDPLSYQNFLSAFLAKMPAQLNEHGQQIGKSAIPSGSTLHVQRRKSFYESIWGKIIALLFLGLTLALVSLMWTTGIVKGSYLFKLAFVIVPGTAYLIYRSFFKRK